MPVQMQNKTLDIRLSVEQIGDDIIAHNVEIDYV